MAFNAKNLHYEKNEPAFLRRLRGEHGGDRNNVQIARPRKDRLKTADEDDGPVVVDEMGKVVGTEEYELMVEGKNVDRGREERVVEGGNGVEVEDQEAVDQKEQKREPEKQKVAEIGAPKKRKVVKVVGDDVEDVEVVDESRKSGGDDGKGASGVKMASMSSRKGRAKAKKVKLSFDELET